MTSSALLFAAALALAGCARSVALHECTDGIDNDADGRFDNDDPGCLALLTFESPDPTTPACGDGIDNDEDGMKDLDDPGCFDVTDGDEFETPLANCRDGIDNDGDGLIDWPNDPGCSLSLEDSETDDCPSGAHCPRCSNGKDDDDDGNLDFPGDIGCDSPGDDDEFNSDPSICGASVRVLPLTAPGETAGALLASASNDLISFSCGGAGPETVYTIELAAPRALRATTNFAETDIDTVLYLRDACRDPGTELACNDDDPNARGVSTLMVGRVEPGQHFLVVDAFRPNRNGMYKLTVELFMAAGDECTPDGEPCAPGFVCRKKTADAASATCEPPECRDGMDNDGDNKIDTPDEPGCADTEDNSEADDCPAGPNCPQCSNETDDDLDGAADFRTDPGCAMASDDFELNACLGGIETKPLSFGLTQSSLTGDTGLFQVGCPFGGFGPEEVYGLIVERKFKRIRLSTVGSVTDTLIAVRKGNCDDPAGQVACRNLFDSGEVLNLDNPEPGGYYVFIESDVGNGPYQLEVTATVGKGEPCDPAEANVSCEDGTFCDAASGVCAAAPCFNGADEDGDGKIDYPNDPGCESRSDIDETDACPAGAGCPACSNAGDDDTDGQIDFGTDIGCAAAGDNDEADCSVETDPIVFLTEPSVTGDFNQLAANLQGDCGGGPSSDAVHVVRFPGRLKELRADTFGSPTNSLIYIRRDACDAEDLQCNDDAPNTQNGEAKIVLTDAVAGTYFIVIDTLFGFGDEYRLNVQGVVAAGQACDPAQIATGLAICESGFFCDAGTCVIAACHQGNDDDGDGKTDFPNDPGCASPSDNDEADTCPAGADCPQCGNSADDDEDGKSNFPDDPGCVSASDTLELDPCLPEAPIIELTDAGDTGTTPLQGPEDLFTGSCHSFGFAPEVVYAYKQTRDLESLTFSTLGSTGDTVLYARNGVCSDPTSEVACKNQFNGGETIDIQTPKKDTYFVFVDGTFNGLIPYELRVSGRISLDAACVAGDTQFTCATGLFCNGTTCQATACNNGVDDDGDGKADATDAGCDSIDDTDEDPDPSPLPACANGQDDDADGFVDFPADIGCERASDLQEENCVGEKDLILPVDAASLTGTTVGASADSSQSCVSSTAPERVFQITFPGALDSLVVDTFGSTFDTVLSVKQASCDGVELGCNDQAQFSNQSEIILGPQPPGLYMILLDGFVNSTGDYTLNVRAVITAGEPCNPAQVTAGIAVCANGQSCTNGVCQ